MPEPCTATFAEGVPSVSASTVLNDASCRKQCLLLYSCPLPLLLLSLLPLPLPLQ